MVKQARLTLPGPCADSYQHVYLSCPSAAQAKCSNESQAIHHPRSKYEMSDVIKTWQTVSGHTVQVWQMTAC